MKVVDKATGAESTKDVTVSQDEGIRADTTYEGVAKIKPAIEGGVISAGNASQFSDGAGVCVVMSAKTAAAKGLDAARRVPRLRGRRLRAGGDGHRAGLRGAEAAGEGRPEGRRHRSVGAQRSVRGAGDLLPRPARHSRRQAQRQRRRDRGRPSVRHVRPAPGRPRADRRQAPRRKARRRHDVHRRRHGRGGSLRGRRDDADRTRSRLRLAGRRARACLHAIRHRRPAARLGLAAQGGPPSSARC